jgi:hypothetical protein
MVVGVSRWQEDLSLGTRDTPLDHYTFYTSAEQYSREGQQDPKEDNSIYVDQCKDGPEVVVMLTICL